MCHECSINGHQVDKVGKGTPSWDSRGSKDKRHVSAWCCQGDLGFSVTNTQCAQWVKANGWRSREISDHRRPKNSTLVWSSLGPFMLLQGALFLSFWRQTFNIIWHWLYVGSKNIYTNELIYKTEIDPQTWKPNLRWPKWTCGRRIN